MSKDFAIEAKELSRLYTQSAKSGRKALDKINLSLESGQVHGLLGPNGAGKTTLCRIASTVLLPTSGVLLVNGMDVQRETQQVRNTISIVFGGDRGLYGRLTAKENLEFWCAMNGVSSRDTKERVNFLLEKLGLMERKNDKVDSFSRGMKQRLHLARGMVGKPKLMILDEPTVGMDPISAHAFRNLIHEIRTEGVTILLTTHDMAEAQELCDTVTFIKNGKIVGSGTQETLRTMRIQGGLQIILENVSTTDFKILERNISAKNIDYNKNKNNIKIISPHDQAEEILDKIINLGFRSFSVGSPTLEDIYIEILDNHKSKNGMEL